MAKKVGLSRSLYNKYERAGIRPTHETLILLANELNTTVDFLIGKTSESIPSTHESTSITTDLRETILKSKELSEESRNDLLKQMELLKLRDNLKKYKDEPSSELRPRLN